MTKLLLKVARKVNEPVLQLLTVMLLVIGFILPTSPVVVGAFLIGQFSRRMSGNDSTELAIFFSLLYTPIYFTVFYLYLWPYFTTQVCMEVLR